MEKPRFTTVYNDTIDPEYWSRVVIPLMLQTMEELENRQAG